MEDPHRVANVSNVRRHVNTKRNILSNTSYGLTKDAEYKSSVKYSGYLQEKNYLQRSVSADNVVIHSRGYKPSDRHDPVKRNFLENLTSRILHFGMEGGETTPINLQKLLTPASDSQELLQSKNKKMFASSYFYAPTHPTVEDQVELARRISHSLSDVKNVKSKGQTMYVNRKKRSVKWIHDGNGIEDEEESTTTIHKEKLPLKCVMNPCGKVLDIHGIQALGEEVNIAPVPKNPEKLFDIVRDLNNQRGRGAEIFAKRRKRSEKWVVDQEQPQTPNTPVTPKTPMYPEKLEINGNTKFMTPSSLTPRTPVSSIDKSFYNPFTVDISLDTANIPITDKHCNANRCGHSSEIKKIYLREIAVGTDSDFSPDYCRSPIVEKSHRIIFDSTNNRRTNMANKYVASNNNTYINNNYQSPRKSDVCNMRSYNGKDTRIQQRFDNKFNDNMIDNKLGNKQHNDRQMQNDNEENGYTPVPVKQLIQEFEKTCRPVLQYKQISPKIIPIVQQCPLDNGIARFFETKNPVNHNNEEKRYVRSHGNYEGSATLQSQCNNRMYDTRGNYERKLQSQYNGQLCKARETYEGSTKLQSRYNGYVSTDESEYTTDDTDSEDYQNLGFIDRGNSAPSALLNCCDSSEYSFAFEDEYMGTRRHSTTSQELEALYANDTATRFVNTEAEMLPEAKSLILSMVTSQENILETKKHLRNTPVLDNLLGTTTPECKLIDVNPELENKLYENDNYTGPKLANLHNLTNYNTAPRGWNQSFTFYRPIKFEKPQEIMYSDF
ncbi:PREDICTED: uncharacterized protein LOC108694821 isoform X1 [Atta colombica]|uniref:uncharacterized protein LOC108694821 isoform X1 n=1 Tax=Atta colombica TaxID=520822 RepID=UPI00084C9243|nr:PREDICTED: uncharacterized protein LOC108694821 isoform X1 [Atta colombica]XP_018059995.1 PREDICTED: uncharacterized protein LOC108694821 isoform X1 [Atta colombica]XP_018060003.1 PREDICTED: uncharacterized protein LOC108694821 isoform X1 [Atta colombica]XP_018060011.1 PREDICTED: uncharacterized protein LOC108694821 isoform X1 [Atta colombica]XP_018060018.1 PREDICTED: uncharacterized protein LOC108694821 isoform X1 [Atta colombica]